MEWLPFIVLGAISVFITISLLTGGKFGRRWYSGGRSWNDRDAQGMPVEPGDNTRTKQWGGTKAD